VANKGGQPNILVIVFETEPARELPIVLKRKSLEKHCTTTHMKCINRNHNSRAFVLQAAYIKRAKKG
jgi:hypothetical protein